MTQLPNGWMPSRLGDLIELNPKNSCEDCATVGFVPMPLLGTRYLSPVKFEGKLWRDVKKGYTHFANRDVLLAKITPCFENGKAGIPMGLPRGLGAGSTEYFVCRTKVEVLEPRYLLAWFKTTAFIRNGAVEMTGSVGHKRVPKEYVVENPIPLAPFQEQKRIADKLDTVLARVDACRERVDRVPVLLDRFRKSVLAAATTGRLTESWRQGKNSYFDSAKVFGLPQGYKRLVKQSFKVTRIDHPPVDLPDGWRTSTIADLYNRNVIVDFADGNHGSLYPRKEDFDGTGALFLTASQIDDRWGVAIEACPRLNHEKSKLLVKGWAKQGDVLLTHNATVGRVGILEGTTEDVLLGTSVTFYRMNSDAYCPKFLRIVFSSPFFQDQLTSVMAQTTRDQVPITKQVSLHVVCPPIDEQREIVRRVELLLALSTQLESRLAVIGDAMERLVPALLAKAFRGELVPQDPNDEPAAELLKRLAKQRSGESKATKGTRTKRAAPVALNEE